jgi:hypothetical protein
MVLFVMGNLKKDYPNKKNASLSSKEGLVQAKSILYNIYTNT